MWWCLALPDAPGQVWIDDIKPMSAKISWTKSSQIQGPISTAESEYFVQFRMYSSGELMEWSEQGEEEISRNLTYVLVGLQPFTKYEIRVVPYIQYGHGTPSDIKQFLTRESG